MTTTEQLSLILVLHRADGGSEELTITAPGPSPVGGDQGATRKE
jgi:hypothetical protein